MDFDIANLKMNPYLQLSILNALKSKNLKMKLSYNVIIYCLFFLFAGCNESTKKEHISVDSKSIHEGEIIFNEKCSSCHNLFQDGIGPKLGGITELITADLIKNFIKDPQNKSINENLHFKELNKKYKNVMPSFPSLKDDEIQNIITFLDNHKQPILPARTNQDNYLKNPIPDTIPYQGLLINLKLQSQIPSSSDSGKFPLTRITKLDYQPGSKKLFILDQRGKLYLLKNHSPILFMDMAQLKPNFIHQPGLATGFGSFAFHPDFAKNGLFYTTHTEKAGSGIADFKYADSIKVALQWVLTEWHCTNPLDLTFNRVGRELFRANFVSQIHGVQEIAFNPTSKSGNEDYGLLYIGVGEGGCVEKGYPFLAHSTNKIWGSILRIDPLGKNSLNGRYGIPKQNPFALSDTKKFLREIYAYGFRNPHRFTWDLSKRMLVSNIGHSNIESIDVVLPGNDYGWPIREGTFVVNPKGDLSKIFSLPANDSIFKVSYPIVQYDHDEGKAICGGFEYTGHRLPQLSGKFLFGDIPSGRLFYFDLALIKSRGQTKIKEWKVSFNGAQKSLIELCGSKRVDLHFGKDEKGELYILTKADGKVYKLTSIIHPKKP